MGRRVFDTRPLRVAAFARLWTASWVTAVGSQLTAVAVPLEIYGFSGSSAYVGLASLAGFVPMVVAALWGGAIADMVDRRRMLLVTSAGIAVTSVLLWAQAAASLKSIAVLLPLIAVQQAMFGANAAVGGAVVPRLVPSGLLLAGIGMALLTRIDLHSNYAADVLPSLLFVGVGLGFVFAPAFSLGTFGVAREDAGVASATINVAQQIGGSIGTSLLNTIAATTAAGYVTAHIASVSAAAQHAGAAASAGGQAAALKASAQAAGAAKQLLEANALLNSYHIVFWVAAGIFFGAAVLTLALLRSGLAIPRSDDEAVAVHA